MKILEILLEEDKETYSCEVVGCDSFAEYYVSEFDGDNGFICKECYEKENEK